VCLVNHQGPIGVREFARTGLIHRSMLRSRWHSRVVDDSLRTTYL
jgi:hypothetical protein